MSAVCGQCTKLCGLLGHACGDPCGAQPAEYWWNEAFPLGEGVAAAHVLQYWLPSGPGGEADGWRVVLDEGRARVPLQTPREQTRRPWLPRLDRLARYGGYPQVFPEAGEAGQRYPVAFGHRDLVPADPGDEGAPEFLALAEELIAWFGGRAALDRRARIVCLGLAREVLRWGRDVLSVDVSDTPGGEPLADEYHLLVRDFKGRLVRLAIAPAARPTDRWDPACVVAGHPGMPLSAEEYEHAVFRTRVAATTALMSELLPLNNNDRVTFEVTVVSHGLDLPADPVAADTTLRTWWDTPASLPLVHPGGWDDEDPVPASRLRITDQEQFAAVLKALEDEAIEWVTWGQADDAEADHVTLGLPGDHLILCLGRDLLDLTTKHVTGSPALAPRLTYRFGNAECGTLVLVGAERVARLAFIAIA